MATIAGSEPTVMQSGEPDSQDPERTLGQKLAFVGVVIFVLGTVLLAIAAVVIAPLALKHKITADVAAKVLAGFGATTIAAVVSLIIGIKLEPEKP